MNATTFDVANEESAAATLLRGRMKNFYDSITNYDAFSEASQQRAFWGPIVTEIEARAGSERCRVLEFGAGRTGFAEFLGSLRSRVEFHVQDVTVANRDYLDGQAERVWIGDIEQIEGQFDVIFSTFVWEHLASPKRALLHLLKLLTPTGCLVLASPRYDVPGYIPPSARRLDRAKRFALSAWLAWRRLRVLLGARPDFLIHYAPACLSGPWFRDADAIHWVSRFDLKMVEPSFEVRTLRIPTNGIKHYLWARAALLFVRIQRRTDLIPGI
jgi:SAM-dependent methyltransferase